MRVRHDEGVAIHIGPEPCTGTQAKRRQGGHRPAIEPRKEVLSRAPTRFRSWKAMRTGA